MLPPTPANSCGLRSGRAGAASRLPRAQGLARGRWAGLAGYELTPEVQLGGQWISACEALAPCGSKHPRPLWNRPRARPGPHACGGQDRRACGVGPPRDTCPEGRTQHLEAPPPEAAPACRAMHSPRLWNLVRKKPQTVPWHRAMAGPWGGGGVEHPGARGRGGACVPRVGLGWTGQGGGQQKGGRERGPGCGAGEGLSLWVLGRGPVPLPTLPAARPRGRGGRADDGSLRPPPGGSRGCTWPQSLPGAQAASSA